MIGAVTHQPSIMRRYESIVMHRAMEVGTNFIASAIAAPQCHAFAK
jgi:hypothetical protein